MTAFALDRIRLPPVDARHGWGSGLIAGPDGRSVVLSLPRGRSANRLCVVDLTTGEADGAERLRGELRDALFVERGGWLLTTLALAELSVVGGRLTVGPQRRPRGLGSYQHRLLAFGSAHLGVTGWASQTIAVLERETGTVVKRIRVTAPHLASASDGAVRLYAPHGGEVVDVLVGSLEVAARKAMITGTAPVIDGAELLLLEGARVAQPRAPTEKLWRVAPQALVALDLDSLEPLRRGASPPGARDVLGVDAAGNVVVSTDAGVALADRSTLSEIARFDAPGLGQPLHAHRWLPELNSVALYPRRFVEHELLVVRWLG